MEATLPLTLMDEIMWKPNWHYIGDKETLKRITEVSEENKWIIEGYITTRARAFLFEKADKETT